MGIGILHGSLCFIEKEEICLFAVSKGCREVSATTYAMSSPRSRIRFLAAEKLINETVYRIIHLFELWPSSRIVIYTIRVLALTIH